MNSILPVLFPIGLLTGPEPCLKNTINLSENHGICYMKIIAQVCAAIVLTCSLATSPAFASPAIDAPPDHINLWMHDPIPGYGLGLARILGNLALIGFAPKISAAAFATTYAAGWVADQYYNVANVAGTRIVSDGLDEKAKLMAKDQMSSSYLFCISTTDSKFAVDTLRNRIAVTGRWTRTNQSLFVAIVARAIGVPGDLTNRLNTYTLLIENETMVALKNKCAYTLGLAPSAVKVRVKNTDYTTKTSGYKVDTFFANGSEGHYYQTN